MLHGDFDSQPINPGSEQKEKLLANGASSDSHVYNFGIREDSEYGASWPQLDENLTPEEALRSKFCRINWIIASILPILINFGIGYGIDHNYAHMGLISENSDFDTPASSAFIDMGITGFCVVFFTSLLSKGAIQKGVSEAKVGPVNDLELSSGIWRIFPLRTKSNWGRSFMIAIMLGGTWYGLSVLILYLMCTGGVFLGDEHDLSGCYFSMIAYLLTKSIWAGAIAATAYPLAFLPAVNRANLTTEQYQSYLKNRSEILALTDSLPQNWPGTDGRSSYQSDSDYSRISMH